MAKELIIKLNFTNILKKTFFSMILMIITSMYTVIDSLFVSNYIGTKALASINISFPLIIIINALGFMIAIGAISWVSIKLGAKKALEAKEDFSYIVYFGFVVTLIISFSLLPFLDSIIRILGAKEIELINYTKSYLSCIILFSPLFILQILFQHFYFVDGNGKLAVIATIVSGVLNILLDYIFIVKLDFGIRGAALATGLDILLQL